MFETPPTIYDIENLSKHCVICDKPLKELKKGEGERNVSYRITCGKKCLVTFRERRNNATIHKLDRNVF